MKRFTSAFRRMWRPALIIIVIILFTFTLLFRYLGSQPAGLSSSEVAARTASQNLHQIKSQPLQAPFTVPERIIIKVRPHSIAAARAVSALYGVGLLILFFAIVRFWQGSFTAILGTILFATSSWFLHTARIATPDVLLLGTLGLIACGLWLKHTHRRNLVIFMCAAAAGIALYIPGFVWFVLGGLVWQRRIVLYELHQTKVVNKLLAGLLLLVLATPLIWASIKHPAVAQLSVGLPSIWPSPVQFLQNAYHIPLQLFVHGPNNPILWLGQSPILNIFEDAMFILGVYAFWQHRELERTRLLLGLGVLCSVLIIIGGLVTITALIPLIYITIAAGLLYTLEVWFSVFPRNPVARGVGILVLAVAMLVSCNYHLREYFVAWPNAPATHAVFTQPATIFDTIKR